MNHRSIFGLACFVLVAALASIGSATTIVLYDDSQGNLPADQSNLFYFGLGTVSQSPVAEGVNFVSGTSTQAGFTPNVGVAPTFDPTWGYSVEFQLQVNEETHNSNDRAGFSVILLGNDVRGVEVAFWENEIWAQTDSPLFTHGEGIAYDTTAGIVDYSLQILGNQYELLANGDSILTGVTKDYTPFTGLIDPYELPNYLFLGDDTSSAAANVTLGQVQLNTLTPEPAGFGMAFVAFVGIMIRLNHISRCVD